MLFILGLFTKVLVYYFALDMQICPSHLTAYSIEVVGTVVYLALKG